MLTTLEFEDFVNDHINHARKARAKNALIKLKVPEGMPAMYVVPSHRGVNEVLKNEHHHFVHFADYFDTIPGKSEVDQKIADIFGSNLGNDDPLHLELRKDIPQSF